MQELQEDLVGTQSRPVHLGRPVADIDGALNRDLGLTFAYVRCAKVRFLTLSEKTSTYLPRIISTQSVSLSVWCVATPIVFVFLSGAGGLAEGVRSSSLSIGGKRSRLVAGSRVGSAENP